MEGEMMDMVWDAHLVASGAHPACRGEEESRSIIIMVFTSFLPKSSKRLIEEGFSLRDFTLAALAEQ